MIREKQDGEDMVLVAVDLSYALRIKGTSGEVHVNGKKLDPSGGGGNSVVWAPFAEPQDGSFVKTWAEAVAAVQLMSGATTIEIYADPDNDTVVIPGGRWDLNNTTIVGKSVGADRDSNGNTYRGWQELLYVVGEGDASKGLWIRGCAGLKDIFFRPTDFVGSDYSSRGLGGSITAYDSDAHLVTFSKPAMQGQDFSSRDVGKPIRIGTVSPWQSDGAAASEGNNGTFIISEVIDANTIHYVNGNGVTGDANNGSIEWDLCMCPFIVTESVEWDSYQPPSGDGDPAPGNFQTNFILDNADVRYGGDYRWGAMFVLGYNPETDRNPGVFIHLVNGSSVRWFSMSVDGYMAIQSDGSAAWIGTLAFSGAGRIDIFAQAGLQFRTYQNAIDSYTIYQPNIVYVPSNPSDWNGPPETVWAALDEAASRIKASEAAISALQNPP